MGHVPSTVPKQQRKKDAIFFIKKGVPCSAPPKPLYPNYGDGANPVDYSGWGVVNCTEPYHRCTMCR